MEVLPDLRVVAVHSPDGVGGCRAHDLRRKVFVLEIPARPRRADGEKIVNHVFGKKKAAVEEAAAGKADVTQEIIAQILPIIAPIVLAWLAKKFLGGDGEAEKPAASSKESSSGGIGDLLGGLMSSKEGQDMLGGLLGGLLGGK